VLLDLTEILRCPADHDEAGLVCVPLESAGPEVVRGVLGCPACRAEYPIADGVADFSDPARRRTEAPARGEGAAAAGPLTAEAAEAFLGLAGPGGCVLLAGAAARLAGELAARVPGVRVVCVNAPEGAPRSAAASYLLCEGALPVKSSRMRGVVLGADSAAPPWPAEGARLLPGGLRLVVEGAAADVPGVVEMARGAGVTVWEKRAR